MSRVYSCAIFAHLHYLLGQSGPFKLAEITHYNINGVLTQLSLAWKYYESARDRVLSTLPFDGVIGVLAIVLWSFFKGVPVVILPKFEPKTFLGCIPKYKITVCSKDPSHDGLAYADDHLRPRFLPRRS